MTPREIIDGADFAAVWHALGGGDLRHGRGVAFWRRGADGRNVSLDPSGKRWYDHARGEGGGVLDLVQTARGGSRGDALQWLADYLGADLEGGPKRTPAERRAWAQRMEDERDERQRVWHWARCRVAALERAKAEAYDRDDLNTLADTSGELCSLHQATGPALTVMWRPALRDDLEGAAECERWGRDDEAFSAALTGIAVAIIAEAERREPRDETPEAA